MDPNQNQQPVAPTPSPVTPPVSAPTPKSSINKLFIGVAIVVFLVVIGIGVYLYLLPQKESLPTTQTGYQTATPTAVPTVAQTAEEREAELIDIGTLDADFTDINQNLQGL